MAARSGKKAPKDYDDDYFDTPSSEGKGFWITVGLLFFIVPIGGIALGVLSGTINLGQAMIR